MTVNNVNAEEVTLTSLTDSVFLDLNGQGTCSVPQTIAGGGSYSCTFTKTLTGDDLLDHVNTATGVAADDDGNTDTASDDATVTFTDVLPDITLIKDANPTSVPETGGDVTFTVTVD